MTAEQYVKQIVKKIKCGAETKKDIEKTLLSEIEERIENGESLEEILAAMGTVEEVSESFNENLPSEEVQKYKRYTKTLKICSIIFGVLCLLWLVLWIVSKEKNTTDQSFNKSGSVVIGDEGSEMNNINSEGNNNNMSSEANNMNSGEIADSSEANGMDSEVIGESLEATAESSNTNEETQEITTEEIIDSDPRGTAIIEKMTYVIQCLDADDYQELIQVSTPQMAPYFTKDQWDEARATVCDGPMGENRSFGNFYMAKLEQMGEAYYICEVSTSYENCTVTYTAFFDMDYVLAGLYMK